MKLTSIVFALLLLGGCITVDWPTTPSLYSDAELPSWYNAIHTTVGDGICSGLTTVFGGC